MKEAKQSWRKHQNNLLIFLFFHLLFLFCCYTETIDSSMFSKSMVGVCDMVASQRSMVRFSLNLQSVCAILNSTIVHEPKHKPRCTLWINIVSHSESLHDIIFLLTVCWYLNNIKSLISSLVCFIYCFNIVQKVMPQGCQAVIVCFFVVVIFFCSFQQSASILPFCFFSARHWYTVSHFAGHFHVFFFGGGGGGGAWLSLFFKFTNMAAILVLLCVVWASSQKSCLIHNIPTLAFIFVKWLQCQYTLYLSLYFVPRLHQALPVCLAVTNASLLLLLLSLSRHLTYVEQHLFFVCLFVWPSDCDDEISCSNMLLLHSIIWTCEQTLVSMSLCGQTFNVNCRKGLQHAKQFLDCSPGSCRCALDLRSHHSAVLHTGVHVFSRHIVVQENIPV